MDKTDKFEWSVGEQEIYPIDYTQEELREANNNKISKIGHANIRKRVVMQKWQENFGKEISYMNADEIEIYEELTFRIPIETWEFFTAYALIAQIEKKGIDGSKNPSDFLVHVIADAFNKAGQEDTFFSRTAYENAGIQNILLSEFWKQEVEPRIQVVRDHLKELDSALILQTMVSLAKTLDDAIVQLKHPKEKRTETDVIDDLLCDLMRFREKRKGHAGPYAVYQVPDLEFRDKDGTLHTMQETFDRIKKKEPNFKSGIINEAREAYLNHLMEQCPKGDFQKGYQGWLAYMEISQKYRKRAEWEEVVTRDCKQMFGQRAGNYTLEDVLPKCDFSEKEYELGYLAHWIREHVEEMYWAAFSELEKAYQYLGYLSSARRYRSISLTEVCKKRQEELINKARNVTNDLIPAMDGLEKTLTDNPIFNLIVGQNQLIADLTEVLQEKVQCTITLEGNGPIGKRVERALDVFCSMWRYVCSKWPSKRRLLKDLNLELLQMLQENDLSALAKVLAEESLKASEYFKDQIAKGNEGPVTDQDRYVHHLKCLTDFIKKEAQKGYDELVDSVFELLNGMVYILLRQLVERCVPKICDEIEFLQKAHMEIQELAEKGNRE